MVSQTEIIDKLLAEDLGTSEFRVFFCTGEGMFFPDGCEEATGFVITRAQRCCFWATDWDEKAQRQVLINCGEVGIVPGWWQVPESRQALEWAGLKP